MKKEIKFLGIAALGVVATAIFGVSYSVASLQAETAEETGTAEISVEIAKHNLSLKDSIYIKYAVLAENVVSSDQIGVLVWNEPQETYEIGTQNATLTEYEPMTSGSATYYVYDYKDMFAKSMTDLVYTRPYVLRDGVYTYGEVSKYSILTYAYNKLGRTEAEATTDEGLKALLQGMLTYGGLAQQYLGYKTDTLASDDFTYVRVSNAKFEDGFDYGLFEVGQPIKIEPAEGYTLAESECISVDENGDMILTVPEETYVDEVAFEEEKPYSVGLAYTLNSDNSSYSVSGIGTCTDTDIIIPEEYEGLPVTKIGGYAFKNCKNLTSVIIPEGIISILRGGFYGCINLTNVTIPKSLETFNPDAFYNCKKLVNVYYGGVIEDWCNIWFCQGTVLEPARCNPLSYNAALYIEDEKIDKLIIPEGVTRISSYAFYGCGSLMNVILPEGFIEIGDSSFRDCKNIKSVFIPTSVKNIGSYIFWGCSSLVNITIPDSVTSINDHAFYGCSALKEIVIPHNVSSIAFDAFSNCSSLVKVVIKGAITSISDYTFYKCSSLTEIVMPDSVTSIGRWAFSNCSSLTEMVMPNNITSIGENAFNYCKTLSKMVLSNNITNIEWSAFDNCNNLNEIYFQGTFEEWDNIEIASDNTYLTDAQKFYYSESEPALDETGTAYHGNYWRYVDGEPTVWVYVKTEE